MARQARMKSESGIYHVMLKGMDDRLIFLEDQDRIQFLECLFKAKERVAFAIIAYCLMDNHVHLLIGENKEENIGKSMQRATVGYVLWHNHKYGRSGHLFQNRFNSETVEAEKYFLTVVRYIHQNPVVAGIVKSAADYKWSSYGQYITAYNNGVCAIDASVIKNYFETQKNFEDFMSVLENKKCLEFSQRKKYTDQELRKVIYDRYANVADIEKMPALQRNQLIQDIYQDTEASARQLGRVLNIGRGIIVRSLR